MCEPCMNSRENCLWRDSVWAKACWICHKSKKECPLPDARKGLRVGPTVKGSSEPGLEAGPSEKRKMGALKGKGKEKEKEKEVLEPELGADTSTVLLAEVWGLHEVVVIGKAILQLLRGLNKNVGFIVYQVEKRFGAGEVEGVEDMEGVEGMGR